MLTTKNVDREKIPEMMNQYVSVKDNYPNDLVLFRVGDFFEAYFEDAYTFSTICGLTFTGKRIGSKSEGKHVNLYSGEVEKLTSEEIMKSTSIIPMAGVPHRALNQYAQQIIYAGMRVVVVEQLEDPKTVKAGQLVKRDIVCILSSMDKDGEYLAEYLNNWACIIYKRDNKYSLCFSDISTSDVFITTVDKFDDVLGEISRYKPSEIITNSEVSSLLKDKIESYLKLKVMLTVDDTLFGNVTDNIVFDVVCKSCNITDIAELEYKNIEEVYVLYILSSYIKETRKIDFDFGKKPIFYTFDNYMSIDASSRANLELTENIIDKTRRGSLISVLDKCITSMGSRLLKQWIDSPLQNQVSIEKRLDAVKELKSDDAYLNDLRNSMVGILDISRIMGRLKANKAIPRDLVNLRESLHKLPTIREKMKGFETNLLLDLYKNMGTFEGLCYLLDNALLNDPASDVRDGLVLKEGYNGNLDTARDMIANSNKYLDELEERERKRTGIKTLKVVNKNGKCSIEVNNNFTDKVPSEYRIEKALKGSTRYATDESEKLERDLYSAIEQSKAIEIELYEELKSVILKEHKSITNLCDVLSTLDVLCSLAIVAIENGYNRPMLNTEGYILIQDGRHPVVEKSVEDFVVNDTSLDMYSNRFLLITGPNMAGKSTYMRQVALIVIMAHIGSYVPALLADIAITDKIFTRIGAGDDISSGRSTFMVEMTEVRNILKNATRNSLVILDEVGRGTSPSDGIAIAYAVSEYVHNEICCKSLFATHYHDLISLENSLGGLKNYHLKVEKEGNDLVFIRKLSKGGLYESYGIDVAAKAGLPNSVITRARKLREDLDSKNDFVINGDAAKKNALIVERLKSIDRMNLTATNAYFQLCHLLDSIQE